MFLSATQPGTSAREGGIIYIFGTRAGQHYAVGEGNVFLGYESGMNNQNRSGKRSTG